MPLSKECISLAAKGTAITCAGGRGEVWRAYDTDTDRIVAIKLLPGFLSDDEEFQQRFRREAHAAARLNNPHVIPIHNYGTATAAGDPSVVGRPAVRARRPRTAVIVTNR